MLATPVPLALRRRATINGIEARAYCVSVLCAFFVLMWVRAYLFGIVMLIVVHYVMKFITRRDPDPWRRLWRIWVNK